MNAQSLNHLHQYRRIDAYQGVETADPHTLVQMLYDGLTEAMTNAQGAIARGDIAAKGQALVRAVDILEGLRTSLDNDKGGEVAANLGRLYEYMEMRLTEVNLSNDLTPLEELIELNATLRDAWAGIPQQARQAAA